MSTLLFVGVLASVGFLALAGTIIFLTRNSHKKHKSVLLRGISPAEQELLQAANIPWTSAAGGRPDGININGRDLKVACKALKSTVLDFWSQDGQAEAVLLSKSVNSGHHPYELRADALPWYRLFASARRTKMAQLVANVIGPVVRKQVVIHIDPTNARTPLDDGCFHVFLYNPTADGDGSKHQVPANLLGEPEPAGDQAFKASLRGVPVRDPQSRFDVAELRNNNLFLLVKTADWDTYKPVNVGLLLRILELSVKEIRWEDLVDKTLEDIKARAAGDNTEVKQKLLTAERHSVSYQCADRRKHDVLCKLVKEILTPVAGCSVRVLDHSAEAPPAANTSKQSFDLVFRSNLPGTSPWVSVPQSVWGLQLSNAPKQAHAPSADGWPIACDKGFVLAELQQRSLIVNLPLMQTGTTVEMAVLARLLFEAARHLPQALDSTSAERTLQSGSIYAAACRELAVAGATATANATPAKSAFETALRKVLLQLDNLEQMKLAPTDELGEEFDQILQLANVKEVLVDNDKLTVKTGLLYCTHPQTKKRHEIGEFDIVIWVKTHKIQWFNNTRRVAGGNSEMNAPHVDQNGNACMGNTKDLFPKLIAGRQYSSAIQMAIIFVESVNLDDSWGKFLNNWPVA